MSDLSKREIRFFTNIEESKMLKGYKTYVVAVMAVLGAVSTFLLGEITLVEMFQLVVPALVGAFLRKGVSG